MEKSKAAVGDSKKSKKPSRKQKRKPSKMKFEYQRRQRRHKWLETHIWHAKRMKMCQKYGYSIADHCSDKGIRQAYMSMTHGCLLSVSDTDCVLYNVRIGVHACTEPAVDVAGHLLLLLHRGSWRAERHRLKFESII